MTSAGSVEESWFDTFSTIESDEDDFKSVQDGRLHTSNWTQFNSHMQEYILIVLLE